MPSLDNHEFQAETAMGQMAGEDAAIIELRNDVIAHIDSLRLPNRAGGDSDKELIRYSHAFQRREVVKRELRAIGSRANYLLNYFANGDEIVPEGIQPELVPVSSDDWTGYLFRFASLLWSVPVSHGYGRRMRFLVLDQHNGKLIGIFALGDPVFNLQCRDQWIGWSSDDRRERLVHLMDAYVVGAVPPYNQILGGKLIASLIGSGGVSEAFLQKYGSSTGIISGEKKRARLALVTVTSALGRSSLYNRLKLHDGAGNTLVELVRLGETKGYGHFQLSDELFERIRRLLISENHPYADGYRFGQGPNWRFRVLREGLKRLGLDEELIRHGIHREVFGMPMTPEFRDFLCGRQREIDLRRPSIEEITKAALNRWMIPRSIHRPEFRQFRREEVMSRIQFGMAEPIPGEFRAGCSRPRH